MNRREFIKLTTGSAALAAASLVGCKTFEHTRRNQLAAGLRVFSRSEAATLSAVADRIVAPLDARELQVVTKIDSLLAAADDRTQQDLKQLLDVFGSVFVPLLFDARLGRFEQMLPIEQDAVLASWRDSRLPFRRSGFQAVQRLCLAVTYATPSVYPDIGYPGPPILLRPDGTTVGGMPAP